MRPPFPRPLAAHQPEITVGWGESEASVAEALLGTNHPLVGLLRGLDTAVDQLVAVTVLQVGGVVFMFDDFAFPMPLVIAAAVCQLGLACRIVALSSSRHELCLRLIAEGNSSTPLRCIETVRTHLLDPRTWQQLARSIDEIVQAADRVPVSWGARALVHPHVIRPAAPLFREVAALLRGSEPAVRGVALVEWLITSPVTPLYGFEAELVLQEAARARYLLTPAASDCGPEEPHEGPDHEARGRTARKGEIMDADRDEGSRDIKFAYTGMGLIILALIVVSILA